MYEVCDMSEPIITISNASIRFNLPMQKQMGLGEYFRTILKRELRGPAIAAEIAKYVSAN